MYKVCSNILREILIAYEQLINEQKLTFIGYLRIQTEEARVQDTSFLSTMNILMYSTYFPPHYSGAAKQAIALAKKLHARGHHIEFATLRREGETFEDSYDSFKVWRLSNGRGKHREFVFWWNFFRFFYSRRKDFNILHSHGAYYYNSIVGPLGRLFRKKSLMKISLANNDLAGLGQGISGKIHHSFLEMVDACVVISRDLQKEVDELRFPSSKVFMLPNCVDTDRFRPPTYLEKLEKKKMFGLSAKQSITLTVGVFDKRKNIGWLIDKWVEHQGFGTGALLMAVGPQSREDKDGNFLRGLKQLAANHPDLIKIYDHVENIEDFYQVVDFFILPSTGEGMPNVVLEAMASGLPCITTRVSGCSDLVDEGVNGFMFQADDAQELHSALSNMLTSDHDHFSHAARKKVEHNFSLQALALAYEDLYCKLISSRT